MSKVPPAVTLVPTPWAGTCLASARGGTHMATDRAQGGSGSGVTEPGVPAASAPPGLSGVPARPGPSSPPGRAAERAGWTVGRVIALVAGSVLALGSLVLLGGSGAVAYPESTGPEDPVIRALRTSASICRPDLDIGLPSLAGRSRTSALSGRAVRAPYANREQDRKQRADRMLRCRARRVSRWR